MYQLFHTQQPVTVETQQLLAKFMHSCINFCVLIYYSNLGSKGLAGEKTVADRLGNPNS